MHIDFGVKRGSSRMIAVGSLYQRIAVMIVGICGALTSVSYSETFIWLETPSRTNFKSTAAWSILSHGNAPAVMPDAPVDDPSFVEYAFEVADAQGPMTLWARTFDPAWSSPARWRIDDGAWQKWTPGDVADMQVENGTFRMDWRTFGTVTLSAGKHTLRIETHGKRAHGDYPYFVLDAVLLTRGAYTPRGAVAPATEIAARVASIQTQAKTLGDSSATFVARAKNIADRATHQTLDAMAEFDRLDEDVTMAVAARAAYDKPAVAPLHGKIVSATLSGGTLRIVSEWNRAFEGAVWIGFTQEQALYAAETITLKRATSQTFDVKLPTNLPVGTITVQLVPIGQPTMVCPQASFALPADRANAQARPSAWGIYRDATRCVHPWNVDASSMMQWDGEPYIPVGGMVNFSSTWRTSAGESDMADAATQGSMRADRCFELLKKHGIEDVYFNGCFPHANPNAVNDLIRVAERRGMHYGIHLSSVPAQTSKGFVRAAANKYDIKSGQTSVAITVRVAESAFRPPHRCVWYRVSAKGELLEQGVGEMKSVGVDAKAHEVRLQLPVTLKASHVGVSTLFYLPEVPLSAEDPSGYFEGIDDYIARVREAYGALTLGPGMRMWVDPFVNEMHAQATSLCTAEAFRRGFVTWLQERYANESALRNAWGVAESSSIGFDVASRVVPTCITKGQIACIDPANGATYAFDVATSSVLRDQAEYRGKVCEAFISRLADVLKSIANVPVILKHNVWVSDWFVNPRKAGGQDGVGFEPYCYGDSLAYHNSLVAYAEALASARHQWSLVTETSPAAFDGQKDYVGYIDRLQMLNDFDLLLSFGAKGVYTFGLYFEPGPFQVTDLTRDTRQLEWLATYAKTVRAAAKKLSTYRPEVYGWYPAHLREREVLGLSPRHYEMDAHYMGGPTQIRMAPDGRWIVPAMRADADWKGLLVAGDLLTPSQMQAISPLASSAKGWILGDKVPQTGVSEKWGRAPLDGATSQGIGVVPASPRAMTLNEFREKVLGYRVFQTADVNGQTLPDGRVMIWTCIERASSTTILPASATATMLKGDRIALAETNGGKSLTLTRPPYEKSTTNLPPYIAYGYYYPDQGQPEVAIVSGVNVDELLKLNAPAWHRWLPKGVAATDVVARCEAEDARETTFTQPRVEGYSRYSEGAAIGINTHYVLGKNTPFEAVFRVDIGSVDKAEFRIRRMVTPTMDIDILVDGQRRSTIAASAATTDAMALNPWNAGIGLDNLKVAWTSAMIGPLSAGSHEIRLVARPGSVILKAALDTQLMGAAAKELAGAMTGSKLMVCQIDMWMITGH